MYFLKRKYQKNNQCSHESFCIVFVYVFEYVNIYTHTHKHTHTYTHWQIQQYGCTHDIDDKNVPMCVNVYE